MTQMIALLNIILGDLLHCLLYSKLQVVCIARSQVAALPGPVYFGTCKNAALGQGTGSTARWAGTELGNRAAARRHASLSRTPASRRLRCGSTAVQQLHSCSMISCVKSKELCKCWIDVCVGAPAARECRAGASCLSSASGGKCLAGLKAELSGGPDCHGLTSCTVPHVFHMKKMGGFTHIVQQTARKQVTYLQSLYWKRTEYCNNVKKKKKRYCYNKYLKPRNNPYYKYRWGLYFVWDCFYKLVIAVKFNLQVIYCAK